MTNVNGNSATPINLATNTPGTAIPVGKGPFGVAITPDGRTAYVTNFLAELGDADQSGDQHAGNRDPGWNEPG